MQKIVEKHLQLKVQRKESFTREVGRERKSDFRKKERQQEGEIRGREQSCWSEASP